VVGKTLQEQEQSSRLGAAGAVTIVSAWQHSQQYVLASRAGARQQRSVRQCWASLTCRRTAKETSCQRFRRKVEPHSSARLSRSKGFSIFVLGASSLSST
jgi:hypothetical protein